MAVAEAKPQYSHAEKKRFRKSFGKQTDKMAIPNLLEIQLALIVCYNNVNIECGLP